MGLVRCARGRSTEVGGVGRGRGLELDSDYRRAPLRRKKATAALMRAGAPDALDLMVASSYGAMAVQQLADGNSGLMMALYDGKYTTVPGDTCIQGIKRVDVKNLYDKDTLRPRISRIKDKPMFLY